MPEIRFRQTSPMDWRADLEGGISLTVQFRGGWGAIVERNGRTWAHALTGAPRVLDEQATRQALAGARAWYERQRHQWERAA